MPGNVRLRKGESNHPQPSVVNVTQVRTIDRSRLLGRVRALGPARVREVLAGPGAEPPEKTVENTREPSSIRDCERT